MKSELFHVLLELVDGTGGIIQERVWAALQEAFRLGGPRVPATNENAAQRNPATLTKGYNPMEPISSSR